MNFGMGMNNNTNYGEGMNNNINFGMGMNNLQNNMNMMCNINNLANDFGNMNLGNNNNSEIKLKFTFVNTQSFLVKCKMEEKLSDVIDRFKKTQCPSNLKDLLDVPVFGGKKADINKTLNEIGVSNNQIILFVSTKKIVEDENEKKEEGYELEEDEKEQVKQWIAEFEGMKLLKQLQKLTNEIIKDEEKQLSNSDINNLFLLNSDKTVTDFYEFVQLKEQGGAIIVKEHSHKLAYCISIFNWKCSLCKKNYSKDDARYYCSSCNFNMCNECHAKKKYTKKKAFQDGIKPSNPDITNPIINTKFHNHNLVYCRSSRSVIGYNGWICDVCKSKFDNEIWSFYCTECDFDLCCKCGGFN
jgi:phage tail tube protein FII